VQAHGKMRDWSGIPSDAVVDDSAVYPPRNAARQFHDLRHERTSRLFEAGLPIEKVALVTGHKDWRQLQRYTNLKVEDLLKLPLRAAAFDGRIHGDVSCLIAGLVCLAGSNAGRS
jgi:hypothetical protein